MMKESKKSIVLITGCSSGIGLATAVYLAKQNYFVYATVRSLKNIKELKNAIEKENLSIKILKLDVRKQQDIKKSVRTILRERGRIDVVVNNAGFGLFGCIEDATIDEVKGQYDTNVFGVVRVIQSVLPIMRKQKYGYIVNISSIAGRVSYPAFGIYASTKFAMEGITEALRHEVKNFGIKVSLVEPGTINTRFGASVRICKKINPSPYYNMCKEIGNSSKKYSIKSPDPYVVAKLIYRIINSKNPKMRYLIGRDAFFISLYRKMFSDRIIEYLIEKRMI